MDMVLVGAISYAALLPFLPRPLLFVLFDQWSLAASRGSASRPASTPPSRFTSPQVHVEPAAHCLGPPVVHWYVHAADPPH